jgi:hypothetical protein
VEDHVIPWSLADFGGRVSSWPLTVRYGAVNLRKIDLKITA